MWVERRADGATSWRYGWLHKDPVAPGEGSAEEGAPGAASRLATTCSEAPARLHEKTPRPPGSGVRRHLARVDFAAILTVLQCPGTLPAARLPRDALEG